MRKITSSTILANIIIDELKEFLYFPLWWYSKGFKKALLATGRFIKETEQTFGLMIWVKNLFVPMFGQTDIAGRIISFFLRLFQIAWKSLALLIFVVLGFIFILIWLVLPIFVVYQIIIHL